MSSLKDIKLFTTQAHPCSYLPGKLAKTLFIDPKFKVSSQLHSQLSELGFRRSGAHMYRPHCDNCQGCIACRIQVAGFSDNRRFRRIRNKNRDIRIEVLDSIRGAEYYELYARYINTRHRNGDMYPASREQYDSFLASTCETTTFFSMRDPAKRLLGVIVCDVLNNALSAVYTFYDVDSAARSLGTFAILWQVAEARRRSLSYVYLGYWIQNCDKMNYKAQFRPLELLVNGHWSLLR